MILMIDHGLIRHNNDDQDNQRFIFKNSYLSYLKMNGERSGRFLRSLFNS